MGTRGVWGFRAEDIDKVTYVHTSSYPTALGKDILEYVGARSNKKLRETARKVVLIPPMTLTVSPQLARLFPEDDSDFEANPSSYDEDWKHMMDSSRFMYDGLCCWAYIVNTDTNKLEVYNSNKNNGSSGRYARFSLDGNTPEPQRSYGVALITEISFDTIRKSKGDLSALIRQIDERSDATFEDRGIQKFFDSLGVKSF
ncbi:hypothetical protein J4462_00790 [Candidatus Pacearchaeota archaeon]|nr:hypothetical protein [Candidatus Pacearchaeota archaeon]